MIRSLFALLLPSTWRSPYADAVRVPVEPLPFVTERPEPGGPFDYE